MSRTTILDKFSKGAKIFAWSGGMLRNKVRELRVARGWTQKELSKRSGLDRGYIANLEGSKSIQRPSADAFIKLARAFNIKIEELYQAAGYIDNVNDIEPRPESPLEILERLKLIIPQRIPVYPWESFPFHAGDNVKPVKFVSTEYEIKSKHIEAYMVRGDCLEPKISDGDVIIVDRDGEINNGDIVACLLDNEFHVLRVRKIAEELCLENNYKKYKFEDCQEIAPVIEFHRRLK